MIACLSAFHTCFKPAQRVDLSKTRTLLASSLCRISNKSPGLKSAQLERAVEKMANKINVYNSKIDSALANNDTKKLVQLQSSIGKKLIKNLELKHTAGNDVSRNTGLQRLIHNQNDLLLRCNELPSTLKNLERLSPLGSPEPVMDKIDSLLVQAAERRDEYSLRAMRFALENHYYDKAKPLSDIYTQYGLNRQAEHFAITQRLQETLFALRRLEPVEHSPQLPWDPIQIQQHHTRNR